MVISIVKKNKAEKGDREFQVLRWGGGCSFKVHTKKVTSEQIPAGGQEEDHEDIWRKRTPGEGKQMQM